MKEEREEEDGWVALGVKKKGKSESFVFTHTKSLPETLNHISDLLFVIFADPVPCKRLMREMMNQNKPISQSLTQTDGQEGG